MILNEENVMTIQDGTVIMVLNPETDSYIECKASTGTLAEKFGEDTIFLTPTECIVGDSYRDMRHFRSLDEPWAVMTRSTMAKLLTNKQYRFS